MLLKVHMDYQQDSLPDGADPLPAVLTFNHTVFAKNQIRIGKYTRCDFTIDASMLLSR
jgi:hypothetical protein